MEEEKTTTKGALIAITITALPFFLLGLILGDRHGRRTTARDFEEVRVYAEPLTEWQRVTLAIMKTESEYDEYAVGSCNDVGVLQITPCYIEEVNRLLDSARFIPSDAFDIRKSIEMFNVYQDAKNPSHDLHRAIYLHNPCGESIGYAKKVLQNYDLLLKEEKIREEIRRWR